MFVNVVFYLSVCSMVGLHVVMSNGGDGDVNVKNREAVRAWAKVFGQINVEVEANETVQKFPNDSRREISHGKVGNETSFENGSDSDGAREGGRRTVHRHRNETGIPMEVFFQWWSVVRPFGNEMATKPIYPWMVAVQSRRGEYDWHMCSGNILTKLHVVTTCRCLSVPTGSEILPLAPKNPSFISVVAGISMLDIPLKDQLFYGQIRNAAMITIHPQCALSHKFDYAVIELEYYLYYTDRVMPIPNLLDTFRSEKVKSSKPGGNVRFPLIKDDDICHAAGWISDKSYGDDNAKGEHNVNDFQILRKDVCFGTNPTSGNQLICTQVVGGDAWKSWSGQIGDMGSGLVCHKRVVGILSHHSGNHVVFASLRPALSFLRQFYQEQDENYAFSPGRVPVISGLTLVFAVQFSIVPTRL